VVVYSSDIDELLQLSTRVLVVHAGVVRETAVDRASVGRLMLGAETDGSS
jgi:ABC-type sugar transport system ATPase subunit